MLHFVKLAKGMTIFRSNLIALSILATFLFSQFGQSDFAQILSDQTTKSDLVETGYGEGTDLAQDTDCFGSVASLNIKRQCKLYGFIWREITEENIGRNIALFWPFPTAPPRA